LFVYEEDRTSLPLACNAVSFPLRVQSRHAGIRMNPERRSITRTTISKNALLFFDAQRGVFSCRVQDITNSGAGIELANLNLLPMTFELTFDKFHTVRECRVVWRHGDFVGVAFLN